MMYSYPFTLRRRAVVVTMDFAAQNLAHFSDHHWLSDEENAIVLTLTEKAFERP